MNESDESPLLTDIKWVDGKSAPRCFEFKKEFEHKYYYKTPNIVNDLKLSPYARTVYTHILRWSNSAECVYQSTDQIAEYCCMSVNSVIKARNELRQIRPELGGKSLILVEAWKDEMNRTHFRYIVENIWEENYEHYESHRLKYQTIPLHISNDAPFEISNDTVVNIKHKEETVNMNQHISRFSEIASDSDSEVVATTLEGDRIVLKEGVLSQENRPPENPAKLHTVEGLVPEDKLLDILHAAQESAQQICESSQIPSDGDGESFIKNQSALNAIRKFEERRKGGDISFIPEELLPLAEAFVEKHGVVPRDKSARKRWIKELTTQKHDYGFNPEDIRRAYDYMMQNDLTISAPGSLTAVAHSLRLKEADNDFKKYHKKPIHFQISNDDPEWLANNPQE